MQKWQAIGAGAALVLGLGLTAVTAPPASAAPGGLTAEPFGPACASIPATGPGSLATMATQPVATAVASLPFLSTLNTAIQTAGLTTTLNAAPALTVFAPTNDAFAAIPQAERDQLLTDQAALAKTLNYHVVNGQKTTADLQNATLITLEGSPVIVRGSNYDYMVNGSKITCGGIQTANATVYVIDSVLVPPQT
ncbi:putative surface protein with fasciclin (FAS1) repeats [Actinocorallia herbida]|uniref:Putative surface protein with fasciclin (FAS1) repeats n=1 Tax=Actinocorallia herbida TaxID=58109 RepID=A0A3N1CNZ2_9ACTN|nr:fasciclin domain-containing protein [Actinocorallia herbida]ROO83031.1 putative surface protein with fasciclin (FAS1) repeats [Actinocorallia herbida]